MGKKTVPTRSMMRLFGVTIVCLGIACSPKRSEPEALVIDVEMAGCTAVLEGPVCLVEGEARIALWTKHSPSTVSVFLGESPIEHKSTSVQSGALTTVSIRANALPTEATLSLVVKDAGREGRFRLPLRAWSMPEGIAEVDKLRRAFQFDEATKRLDQIDLAADVTLRALAMGRRARMARVQGKTDEAIVFFRRAIDLDVEAGRHSDEIRDRAALSFTLTDKNQFLDARTVLDPWLRKTPRNPENRAMLHYHLGVIAHRAGDYRKALEELRAAEESAERVDLSAMRLDAMEVRADVLRWLGRQSEAHEVLTKIAESLPGEADACRRAGLFTNLGWNLLDRSTPSGESPQTWFERAMELYRTKCPDASLLANALTNVARVFVLRESFDEAARFLTEAQKTDGKPSLTLAAEQLELQAFIELGQSRGRRPEIQKSLSHFEQLAMMGEGAALWDARWIAALGRAQCFEALNDVPRARSAFADAERMLDESSVLAPLGEGRGMYLDKRASSARRYLELLVREKDQDAVRVARHSRARNLSSLAQSTRSIALDEEQRKAWEKAIAAYRAEREALDKEVSQKWTLSKSQLAESAVDSEKRAARLRSLLDHATAAVPWGPERNAKAESTTPRDGELFLVYHPLMNHRWVGFAQTRDAFRMHVIDDFNPAAKPEELSVRLLEPFRREIEQSSTIRIYASAPLDTLDIHALPFGGEPLLHRAAVVYAVDIDAPRPATSAKDALFIVDPRGDLPGARAEGQWAAQHLTAGGIRVDSLQGELATYAAVRDAVEKPSHGLLHYAGHGLFRGHDGFQSALPLASEGEFTVADVLALRFVPPVVVLSGCETVGAGLGVSQAFALVGARSVVAAPRKVDDAVTARIMRGFYTEWMKSQDVRQALRGAQLDARLNDSRADWAVFRVIEP